MEATMTGATVSQRLAHMDNLRSALVAWIIGGHALLGYSAIGGWEYAEVKEVTLGARLELVLAAILGPSALLVIGTFFFIAGLFVPRSLARRGLRRFVRERVIRLGLPYLAFALLLWPLQVWLMYRAAGRPVSYGWVVAGRDPLLDAGALWFAAVLLIFSLVYAGLVRVGLVRFGSSPGGPSPGGSSARGLGPRGLGPGRSSFGGLSSGGSSPSGSSPGGSRPSGSSTGSPSSGGSSPGGLSPGGQGLGGLSPGGSGSGGLSPGGSSPGGSSRVGSDQNGPDQNGSDQDGPSKNGPSKNGPSFGGSSPGGSSASGSGQDGLIEDDSVKSGRGPVGSLQGTHLVALAAGVAVLTFVVRLWLPARGTQPGDLHLWQWPQCAAMFGLGIAVAPTELARRVPDRLRRGSGVAVLAVLGMLPLLAVALGTSSLREGVGPFLGGWRWQALVTAAVEGTLVVAGSVWLLGTAQRTLTGTGRLASACARGAYAAFVLQGPILLALAIAARPLAAPAEIKAFIVAAAAISCSFWMGWLLVTRTRIGRVL